MHSNKRFVLSSLGVVCLVFAGLSHAQPPTGPMSFFITSEGSGNGGNLGGLTGADANCQVGIGAVPVFKEDRRLSRLLGLSV